MIRLASVEDAAAVLAIYAPLVEETAISFEWSAPSVAEMGARIGSTLETHPWLLFCAGDRLLGYAYASAYRSRAAYQWSTEVSTYVRTGAQRRGIATRLYRALFSVLTAQGFTTAYAVISLPNEASVALHERLGFARVGHFPAAGYKLGRWHDVGFWRYALQEPATPPEPPVPLAALRGSPRLQESLRASFEDRQDGRGR